MGDKEKTDEELELETLKAETLLVEAEVKDEEAIASAQMQAERVASRQRTHEIKVAKFLAGGEF